MKKSLSYWSFPGGLSGEMPIIEAARSAREAGYQGIELALSWRGELTAETTDKEVARLRDALRNEGMQIAGLASVLTWDRLLTAEDAHERQAAIDLVARGLRVGAILEAGAFLIIPGAVDVFFRPDLSSISYSDADERLRRALDALVPIAEECGVALALENVWNRFLLSPLEVRALVDAYRSEFLGVYFDVGNVMLTGYPEDWIRILGHRIRRVHFKDFKRSVGTAEGFVDLLAGDVNWPAVMRALRQIGYDGFCTAELIPCYRFAPEVRWWNASRAMDAIFAMAG
ncbi:MAG: fructoselysine 3-epimerase [candidate division BRC1 bacterium ADurb.BinA292]|nr:MAG: fructoselysine 3-epimerase [candidate division BRC1 bacterium ADurb.BinA292]